MAWLNAVVEVIKSLAWPALLLTGLLLFRKPLVNLVRALTEQIKGAQSVEVSGGVGNLTAELKLQRAKLELQEAQLQQAKPLIELIELQQQVPAEPRPAIEIERGTAPDVVVDRLEKLQAALAKFAAPRGIRRDPGGNPLNASRLVAGALLNEGAIRSEIYNAIDVLCDLLEQSAQRSLSSNDDETVDRLLSAVLNALV